MDTFLNSALIYSVIQNTVHLFPYKMSNQGITPLDKLEQTPTQLNSAI